MTVDPKSVDAVFVAALGAADPAARAAILDRECGPNADLRRRVEARLKDHEEATSIVERRPGAAAASVSPAADATVQIAASTGPGPADASRQDEETSVAGVEQSGAEVSLEFLQPSTKPGSLGRLGHHEVL